MTGQAMHERNERQITIPPGLPATEAQRGFVAGLQRRLHLPDALLSNHCVTRFGKELRALDRAETSALIDEMQGWTGIPAQLQREAGQQDLPGFGA